MFSASLKSYRRRLGRGHPRCSSLAGILISRKDLDLPVVQGNAEIAAAAHTYLLSQYGRGDERLAGRVRAMIRPLLAVGRCGNEHVATALALHPRTMHRRLALEGVRFDDIKDEVRREMAEIPDQATRLSVAQIASALGYAEQSALSRSCVRWFGSSPRALRQMATDRHAMP